MAHTVDNKEKILQFRKFAEGVVQSGALSLGAEIYQRNSSQGLRPREKERKASKTTSKQADPTQKARPPKTQKQ